MKKTSFILFLILINLNLNAQIAIGKDYVDGDALIDFAENEGGLILPIVSDLPLGNYTGTLLVDENTATVKAGTNSAWISLTDTGRIDESSAIKVRDKKSKGAVVGHETATAEGVLVLENDSKALVLPKVYDPVNTLRSPIIGTICYDTKSETIAIFDGKYWSFWK